MKKKILLLSFATLLCSVHYSFARDANPVMVRCFEVEGATIYDVRGCVPGSDISFYSQQGGGAMLKEVPVNANGSAKVVWNQNTAPAFVLNVLNANASGIAGNGMVSFTGDKEFIVNDLSIDNHSGNITLRWNASVGNPQNYTFEVLKSLNGADWSVVETVNAQSAAMLSYSFTDLLQIDGNASYQVRVLSSGKEIYYTSNPLYADGGSGISVYPTVAHSTINVKLHNTQNSEYRIVNLQGQIVASGTFNNTVNSCSVTILPAGNYLMEISSAGKRTTTKFIKE